MDKVARGVDANKIKHVKRFATSKLFDNEINQLLAHYLIQTANKKQENNLTSKMAVINKKPMTYLLLKRLQFIPSMTAQD